MKRKNNIVLTGGHGVTTAMALVEALKKQKGVDWEISWIGSKRAVEGGRELTLEFKIFPKMDIRCYEIVAGRVQRKWTKYTIWSLVKIPVGFLHALLLLVRIRPKVLISFGGFAAFPVVVGAWVMRIPIIIHDQTTAAGLANRFSAFFARKVAISRSSSKKYFPVRKTVLTGNPVREAFFKIPEKDDISAEPTIYATGGSRGSKIFNSRLLEALPEILKTYNLIHQCGDGDLKKCIEVKDSLPPDLKKKYDTIGTVNPSHVPLIFQKADIIIGRSGANTVSEVIAARRPAIFVPIPWSQHDEQTKNASLAEDSGIGVIIKQEELTPEILLEKIADIAVNYKRMTALPDDRIRTLDKNAAQKLSDLAASLL